MAITAALLIPSLPPPPPLPDLLDTSGLAPGVDSTKAEVGGTGVAASAVLGLLGSETTFLQLGSGGPQRPWLSENEEAGNAARDGGMAPVRRLEETLKSCRLGRDRPDIVPENLLELA